MKNNHKPSRPSTGGLKIAGGYMSESDRQILRDHEKVILKQSPAVQKKEFDRMNKMYNQYGMHFGVKGV
jgi:hypothetical protein